MTKIKLGDIVWATSPFNDDDTDRPFLIINNDNHPYSGEEYMAVPVTTQNHSHRIELSDSLIERGSLNTKSYVTPWTHVSINTDDLKDWTAHVNKVVLEDVRKAYLRYTLEP